MLAEANTEEAIFKAAIKLESDDQAAYVERVCMSDPPMLARLRALLEAHRGPEDFLDRPAVCEGITADASGLTEGPGDVIGPYKLLAVSYTHLRAHET